MLVRIQSRRVDLTVVVESTIAALEPASSDTSLVRENERDYERSNADQRSQQVRLVTGGVHHCFAGVIAQHPSPNP